jgi:aryl-alcohol dehydrogenase-like predicted oxidoreductase
LVRSTVPLAALIWSCRAEREIAQLEHQSGVTAAVWSPDDERVLTGCANGNALSAIPDRALKDAAAELLRNPERFALQAWLETLRE